MYKNVLGADVSDVLVSQDLFLYHWSTEALFAEDLTAFLCCFF